LLCVIYRVFMARLTGAETEGRARPMGWLSRRLAAWSRRAAGPAAAAGIALLSLGLAPLAVAAPGQASAPGLASLGITGKFGLAPVGQHTSYFQLNVAPGKAAKAAVIATNLAHKTQTLVLGYTKGATASNGGSAFPPAAGRCSGSACWVTGLPSRVTLSAGERELLPFTVRVPPGASPGQYLSGIAASPATLSAPEKLGSNGHGSATQAVIRDTVTIGVAVTVGNLAAMVSRLSIRGVQAVDEGPVARLNISLYNTGHTFSGGRGQATCQAAGRSHSYVVPAGLVLPGDHALIPVNAPGLPEGTTVPCTIKVRYSGQYGKVQVARWSGPVVIPGVPAGRAVRTGAGSYAMVSDRFPAWGIALSAACVLLLGAVCFLLYRQRRPRWR
jgi:hypothetical protein